jgi:hypothetical protein
MAPPKVGAPSHTARKTHSTTRSPQEKVVKVENPIQLEGVVDVDAIPSPIIEPISPTMVEEKNL